MTVTLSIMPWPIATNSSTPESDDTCNSSDNTLGGGSEAPERVNVTRAITL